jgi:hypothetical protein
MGPLRTVQQQQQTTTVALCTGGLEFFQGRAEPPPLHRWTARVRRREGLAPMHTDAAWGRRSSKTCGSELHTLAVARRGSVR